MVKNLTAMILELVQTLQPNSANPTLPWYSQASQYNNSLTGRGEAPRPLSADVSCT